MWDEFVSFMLRPESILAGIVWAGAIWAVAWLVALPFVMLERRRLEAMRRNAAFLSSPNNQKDPAP